MIDMDRKFRYFLSHQVFKLRKCQLSEVKCIFRLLTFYQYFLQKSLVFTFKLRNILVNLKNRNLVLISNFLNKLYLDSVYYIQNFINICDFIIHESLKVFNLV